MTRAVSLAAAFYPRRAQCLEQSLTLYVLLRRRGVPADLKLGVRPRPFYAHAWVEVRGRALGEAADLPMNLVAFPSLGV
jgi:transglutaminase-like putative cysteine protease